MRPFHFALLGLLALLILWAGATNGFADGLRITASSIDLSPCTPQPADSSSEWTTAVDGVSDETKYNHDSSLIHFGDEWILGWNANKDPHEGVSGQKNLFSRSSDWRTLRGVRHIAEFQSPDWSTNPVAQNEIEWHPTLMRLGNRLECWWFATADKGFDRSVGYRSVWNPAARKWTNFKIQLLARGKVGFSPNVGRQDPEDRTTIDGVSYVPMPLATPVVAKNGVRVMPMILSPATGGTIAGNNELVMFSSTDEGESWRWGKIIGKEPGDSRSSVWEPWMTWDGDRYHLFCRNFGSMHPGKGYSYSSTADLNKWPLLADASLDVMPMRGETATDGRVWYTTLSERPQISDTFNSNQRIGMSLFRSRNGADWQPVAPLFPAHNNSFYCWPYIYSDGYLYFSSTVPPGIAVGRLKLPDPDKYYVVPTRSFLVGANKAPWSDGLKLTFAGPDYLRVPAIFEHGKGFSMAALVRTSNGINGAAVDFLREQSKTWGFGFLPIFDGGWRLAFPGWATDIKTRGITGRTGELCFVGFSFDEQDQVLRLVRRNESDRWESIVWYVQTLRLDRLPEENTTVTINGITYRWTRAPAGPGDIALSDRGAETVARLRAAVLKNDPHARAPTASAMYSTTARSVRSQLLLFFDLPPTPPVVDGVHFQLNGNLFDVPKDRITINGNNRMADGSMGIAAIGATIWRFGLWNSRLSADDFKSLYNGVGAAHGLPPEATPADKAWESADVLLDPTKPDTLPPGIDYPGHIALNTNEGLAIYGDGAAAVEVPGRGDWEWEAEFRFDEFPVGMSWDLLTVGNKLSLGRLEISRDSESVYSLKRGDTTFCQVKPNEWTKLKIRYKAGDAELVLPIAHMLRASARPLLNLGRSLFDQVEPPQVNRPVKYRTVWRNLRLTAGPDAH